MAAAAITALTVTQAFASGTSGSTVYACVSKATGSVHIVSQSATCHRSEYSTSWNVTGPQGQTGPQGSQGPSGAAAPNPTPRAKVVGTVTLTPNGGDSPVSFDIYDFSSTFQQTVNIGSQSGGAGAGKVTFQPLTMTKLPDTSSPQLFSWLASGTALQSAKIQLYGKEGSVAETFDCKLVALSSLTTTNTGAANDSLFEQLSIEVGAVTESVGASTDSWNRVTNTTQ
jgi:Type VI secretion system effector, Hcp